MIFEGNSEALGRGGLPFDHRKIPFDGNSGFHGKPSF
jgi:hypothetical protein